MPLKFFIFFLCKYRMVDIKAETWNKAGVSTIKIHENDNVDKTVLLFLYISGLDKRSGCKNIYDLIGKEIKGKYRVKKMNELTKQRIRKFKIDRARLIKDSKHSMYVNEDIADSIIMQSPLSNSEIIKFRSDLGFNQINLIPKKEQSDVIPLLKAFSAEKIKLQHKALKNERVRADMYFSEHKLVVEIDEKGHTDRNQNKENKRQIKIKEHLNWKFSRINPDVEGFDNFLEISKVQNYITQSNEEKLKSEIAKELLNYISSISKSLKNIRYFIEKMLHTI